MALGTLSRESPLPVIQDASSMLEGEAGPVSNPMFQIRRPKTQVQVNDSRRWYSRVMLPWLITFFASSQARGKALYVYRSMMLLCGE